MEEILEQYENESFEFFQNIKKFLTDEEFDQSQKEFIKFMKIFYQK